jgi:hypothetical protein
MKETTHEPGTEHRDRGETLSGQKSYPVLGAIAVSVNPMHKSYELNDILNNFGAVLRKPP